MFRHHLLRRRTPIALCLLAGLLLVSTVAARHVLAQQEEETVETGFEVLLDVAEDCQVSFRIEHSDDPDLELEITGAPAPDRGECLITMEGKLAADGPTTGMKSRGDLELQQLEVKTASGEPMTFELQATVEPGMAKEVFSQSKPHLIN